MNRGDSRTAVTSVVRRRINPVDSLYNVVVTLWTAVLLDEG